MDDEHFGLGAGQASAAAALLFTQAIHDGPSTAALYAERARAFSGTGNLAAAAADAAVQASAAAALLFMQAIHDGPPTAALYAERARAFSGTGNLAAAAADAAVAAELDPTMPRAFLHRARACIGLERYVSARAAVLAGAALAPGDARFAELAKEIDEMVAVPERRRTSALPVVATAGEKLGKVIGPDGSGGVRQVGHRRASSSVL